MEWKQCLDWNSGWFHSVRQSRSKSKFCNLSLSAVDRPILIRIKLDAEQDLDPDLTQFYFCSQECQFTLFYLSRQRHRSHNFQCLSVKKYTLVLHLVEMDTDPDPNPPKLCRSDRIQIHNTVKKSSSRFCWVVAARTLEWRRCFCPRSPPSSTWRSPEPPLSSRVSLEIKARVFIKGTRSQHKVQKYRWNE